MGVVLQPCIGILFSHPVGGTGTLGEVISTPLSLAASALVKSLSHSFCKTLLFIAVVFFRGNELSS